MTYPTRDLEPLPWWSLARAAAAAMAAGLALVACGDADGSEPDDEALAERQADIAERGAEVMPFDLDATTHSFEPTDDGLVQTVVAHDPDDAEQVDLIREHLEDEADRFSEGDLGDPATIHGEDMPGLADLEAGADAVAIEVDDLADGARMTYTTDDPDLIEALHTWGEAQISDHGEHAGS